MAKRKPMTATAFHKALEYLELRTFDQAAAVLGTGRRSLVRYGTGERRVPRTLEQLLECYIEHGIPEHRRAV